MGQRRAEYVSLAMGPGVFSNTTGRGAHSRSNYMNWDRWVDSSWVRWHKLLPEKQGGWAYQVLADGATAFTPAAYLGVARDLHDWSSIDGQYWISLGTHLKLYVVNQATLYDITPQRKTSNVTNALATTNGSTFVTVTDVNHQAATGDFVFIQGAGPVGGITLTGNYQLAVIDPDTYTVFAATPATATASGGGSFSIAYDIGTGLPANGELLGYGTGRYGIGTYGTPRPAGTGVFARMRTWSLDNYGQDLIASQSDGEIYIWERNGGPNGRATLIAGAPQGVQRVIVDANQRVIIALGCTDVTSAFDAMLVRWCSFNDINDWVPTDVNTASEDLLTAGSRIITGLKTKGQNLIWTDTTLYRMVFVGAPDIYDFIPAGMVTIVGPNAAVDVDGVAYFMGFDNFYNYSGTLNLQACDVWETVFDPNFQTSLNRAQSESVVCFTYEPKTEVTWLYPSLGGMQSVTFLNPILQGDTSGELVAAWPGPTGFYNVQFSDQEAQVVFLTNGQVTATWGLPAVGGSAAGGAPADPQALCATQSTTYVQAPLVFNGTLAGPTPIAIGPPARITVTQVVGVVDGVLVTINGTDNQGQPASEVISTVAASTVTGNIRFSSVDSVTSENGSISSPTITVQVGTAAVAGEAATAAATLIGNDRYVTFNWEDGTWYAGAWQRTSAMGRAPAMGGFPYGVNAGYLYQHEVGIDAAEPWGNVPLGWFMKSLDITVGGAKSEYTMGGSDARFAVGGSDAHLLIRSLIPDWKYMTGQMNVTLFTKDRPQEQAYVQDGPVLFGAATPQVDIDAHGSQVVMQFDNFTGGLEAALLLHMDDGDAFTDYSVNGIQMTAAAGATTETGVVKFGTGAGQFDGATQYVTSPNIFPGTPLDVGQGDFTVEFWVYPLSLASFSDPFAFARTDINGNSGFVELVGNQVLFACQGGSSNGGTPSDSSLAINGWHHIAMCSFDGQGYGFVDGVQVEGSPFGLTSLAPFAGNVQVSIGASSTNGGGFFFNGYVDEFRLLNGTALYTQNFMPPAAPFDPTYPNVPSFGSNFRMGIMQGLAIPYAKR